MSDPRPQLLSRPNDDNEPSDLAETEPGAHTGRVKVPVELDIWDRPARKIEVDPAAAGQWDARQWHDSPPL